MKIDLEYLLVLAGAAQNGKLPSIEKFTAFVNSGTLELVPETEVQTHPTPSGIPNLTTWISPDGEVTHLMSIPKKGMNAASMQAEITNLNNTPTLKNTGWKLQAKSHERAKDAHKKGFSKVHPYWVTPEKDDDGCVLCRGAVWFGGVPRRYSSDFVFNSLFVVLLELVRV